MLYLKHLQILSIFIFCSLANASTLPDFTNIVDKNIDAVVIVNAVRSTNTNSNTNVPNIPDEFKPFLRDSLRTIQILIINLDRLQALDQVLFYQMMGM